MPKRSELSTTDIGPGRSPGVMFTGPTHHRKTTLTVIPKTHRVDCAPEAGSIDTSTEGKAFASWLASALPRGTLETALWELSRRHSSVFPWERFAETAKKVIREELETQKRDE